MILIEPQFRPFFKEEGNPGNFLDWLQDNEHIYRSFESEAFRLIAKGRTHYSARTIVEVLVHESLLRENSDDPFKISNARAPDLARVFVVLHPEHRNFWEYRRADWPDFLKAIEDRFGPHSVRVQA